MLHTNFISSRKAVLLVFAVSCLLLLYWVIALHVNVYRFPFTGAIFEMLWLPMLFGIFLVPAIAFIQLFKKKSVSNFFPVITLLIGLVTISLFLLK